MSKKAPLAAAAPAPPPVAEPDQSLGTLLADTIGRIATAVDAMSERLGTLETKVSALDAKMTATQPARRLNDADKRVDALKMTDVSFGK